MELFEKTLKENTVYSGRIITVRNDEIELPNGKTAQREYIVHHGGAAIVALTENKEIFLVRQYRYGASKVLLEIPAGKLEKGEDPFNCATRELNEEIGYTSDNVSLLGTIVPTPAYCGEYNYIYYATDLKEGNQHLDEDEFLEIDKIPFDKAFEMVMSGEIIDAKTCFAILKIKNLLNL